MDDEQYAEGGEAKSTPSRHRPSESVGQPEPLRNGCLISVLCLILYVFLFGVWGWNYDTPVCINTSGKIVDPPSIDFGKEFSDNLRAELRKREIHNPWWESLVDERGHMVLGGERWIKVVDDASDTQSLPHDRSDFSLRLCSNGPASTDACYPTKELQPFHDGLAIIRLYDLWGYVGRDGRIPFHLSRGISYPRPFSEGLARVDTQYLRETERLGQKGGWGFIDTNGDVVIEPVFAAAYDFTESRAAVLAYDGGWGFINPAGELLIPHQYRDVRPFKDGLAYVAGVEGLWSAINPQGKLVFAQRFESILPPSEGLAAAKLPGKKWGYINNLGEFVIKPRFDEVASFSEGLAAVSNGDGLFGFVNTSGEVIIDFQYGWADSFSEGLAAVVSRSWGKWRGGYIDNTGSVRIPFMFGTTGQFKDGVAVVHRVPSYLKRVWVDVVDHLTMDGSDDVDSIWSAF